VFGEPQQLSGGLAGLRSLLSLPLCKNLVQPLSFDSQAGTGGLCQLLRDLQPLPSHDYKNTPMGTFLKPGIAIGE